MIQPVVSCKLGLSRLFSVAATYTMLMFPIQKKALCVKHAFTQLITASQLKPGIVADTAGFRSHKNKPSLFC